MIGAVVGVAGLGVSAYGVVLARRPQQTGAVTAGAGSQVVSGSAILGDNIQIGQARDVNLHDE
jgi:hypothetical protein